MGAARHLAVHDIPLLSINVGGHLGFLTHDRRVLRGDVIWQRLLDDQFAMERRMMLQAMVDRRSAEERAAAPLPLQQPDLEDDEEHHWALNDFYLRAYRDEISPTCTLELEIDGEVVDQLRGDGLILSTPTGSTGYALAAGGPILHPGIDAIIVAPICPMSLSSRTVVVPPRARLVIWPLVQVITASSCGKTGWAARCWSPVNAVWCNRHAITPRWCCSTRARPITEPWRPSCTGRAVSQHRNHPTTEPWLLRSSVVF